MLNIKSYTKTSQNTKITVSDIIQIFVKKILKQIKINSKLINTFSELFNPSITLVL
jgi:hypothetical protein